MLHHQRFFVLGKIPANSIAVLSACCHRSAAFWSVCLFLVLVLLCPTLGIAADKKATPVGLEQYLKSLKYGAVSFLRDSREQSLVDAKIGNKKVRLTVDSGCVRTLLSPSSAKGLKTLGQLGVTLSDSFFGENSDPDVVLIDKLVLGEAQFFNQPSQVERFKFDYMTVPFEGILGSDFLLRNHCLHHFGSGKLYFRSEKLSEEESSNLARNLKENGFVEIPIELSVRWVVEVMVNGEPVRLMLDTGATVTVLDESQMKRLSLTTLRHDRLENGSFIAPEAALKVVGLGSIGRHEVRVVTLRQFQVGSRPWNKVQCGVMNLEPWFKGSAFLRLQGLLGQDFLLSQHAIVDFGARKLWLAPEIKNKK